MVKQVEEKESRKILAQNKKARFDYHIIETIEAGLVLTGAEIKSIRQGGASLAESYVRPQQGELYLVGAHFKPYSHSGGIKDYDPMRARKLLLKKDELDKLRGRVEAKGFTLVALSLYLKNGYAKIELALAKGKDAPDKRQSIKDRESKREMQRATKSKR